MTFEVYLDGTILYYPNDEEFVISNGVVNLALNEAGSFECDVPAINPRYSDFENRRSKIEVYQNGVEIFSGEVREIHQAATMTKHIYAVGELAFLFDSIQPQWKYQTSPAAVFSTILERHNAQVEAKKQFEEKGSYISVKDPNNYIYRYSNREDTLTFLRDKICDPLEGYLRIRKSNGKRYLDIVPLESYTGNMCMQKIEFGENLLDYTSNLSASNIATSVIPLGARIEDEKRDSEAVEGLDEYLTIASINNGYEYINNDTAINKFGVVRVVKKWDDVTTKENLLKKAQEWLKTAQFETTEITVKAIDNNILDINVDSFDLGDRVEIWAPVYGIESLVLPVRKKTIYINNISQNTIVLGDTYTKSYTSQASEAASEIQDMIPQESSILRSAKENAKNMLNGSVGGHVIFVMDESEKFVEQIAICNNNKLENSTNKWVWNLNGLGFMHRNTMGPNWDDSKLETAITMDGSIVANFITSGLLRLSGAVANGSNKNTAVHLEVYDGDKLIGSWGSEGISIAKGSIKSSNYSYSGGNYSAAGTEIELTNGRIRSKNFSIDEDGNAFYKGTLNASQITAGDISAERIKTNVISAINGTDGTVTIEGGKINITGNTTFQGVKKATDGLGGGTTTIDGACIKTGSIISNGFKDDTSSKYSKKGMSINLENGVVKSPNFGIDKDGNAYYNGSLSAKQITTGTMSCNRLSGGKISGQVISGGSITCNQGTIAGFKLSSSGLWYEDDTATAAAGVTQKKMGVASRVNSSYDGRGYGVFKAEADKGRAWLNTANGNGGFYVCNGGGNTETPINGDYIKITAVDITKSDGSKVPFAKNAIEDEWITTGIYAGNVYKIHVVNGLIVDAKVE